MQGTDVGDQTSGGYRFEGGIEQDAVVAVGTVGGPTYGYPHPIDCQGPLPA